MPSLSVLRAANRFNRSLGHRRSGHFNFNDHHSTGPDNNIEEINNIANGACPDVYKIQVEPYKEKIDPNTGEVIYITHG
jgi:hypothetical protein